VSEENKIIRSTLLILLARIQTIEEIVIEHGGELIKKELSDKFNSKLKDLKLDIGKDVNE